MVDLKYTWKIPGVDNALVAFGGGLKVNPRQSALAAHRASACATVVLAEKRSDPAGIAIAGSETNLVAPPPGPAPAEIACRPPYARTYLRR